MGSVSPLAGSVTERRTAPLEMTRLLKCVVVLSPSVETSLPAALESVLITGETRPDLHLTSDLSSLLAGCVMAGRTVRTSLTRPTVWPRESSVRWSGAGSCVETSPGVCLLARSVTVRSNAPT